MAGALNRHRDLLGPDARRFALGLVLIAISMDRWLLAPIERRTIQRWGLVIDTAKET